MLTHEFQMFRDITIFHYYTMGSNYLLKVQLHKYKIKVTKVIEEDAAENLSDYSETESGISSDEETLHTI